MHPPLITFHIFPRENEVFISIQPIEGEDIANTPSPLMFFLFNFILFSKIFLLSCIYSICNCTSAPDKVKNIKWKEEIRQEITSLLENNNFTDFLGEIEEKELELKSYYPAIFGTFENFQKLIKDGKIEVINKLIQKFLEENF